MANNSEKGPSRALDEAVTEGFKQLIAEQDKAKGAELTPGARRRVKEVAEQAYRRGRMRDRIA